VGIEVFTPELSPDSYRLLNALFVEGWRWLFFELPDGRVRCAMLRGGLDDAVQGEGTTGDEAVRQATDLARLRERHGTGRGRRRKR
jgi:hypothetical protein